MSYSLFIGRWQPLHRGHIALIEKVLGEGKKVLVAVRDTELSEDNPYTLEERYRMFRDYFGGRVELITIPDISEICFGRDVGYALRRLDTEETVRASDLRKFPNRIIWLTGNSGAGKTTLAYALKGRLRDAVVLDGDEMRSSVSVGAGFGREDRRKHNLRVARLARILHGQGLKVIVSVIAPYRDVREEIDEMCGPLWVLVCGGRSASPEYPYEPPMFPDLTVPEDLDEADRLELLWNWLWSREGYHVEKH